MLKFFDKQSLTPEQQQRWIEAFDKYEQIQKINSNNSYLNISEEEKEFFRKEYNLSREEDIALYLSQFSFILGGKAGDEKSALFNRFLEGKKALLYPPPTSMSYPWYSVIEDRGPWEIFFLEKLTNLTDIIKDNKISIHECDWEVCSVENHKEIIITYPKWRDLGFFWKLHEKELSCRETKGFIVSWHNKDIHRVTTLLELIKEQEWQTIKYFSPLKLLLDPAFAASYEQDILSSYGPVFGKGILHNSYAQGKRLLEDRREKNLSDYPSVQEINDIAQLKTEELLQEEFSVDREGNLHTRVWLLERLSPLEHTPIYL